MKSEQEVRAMALNQYRAYKYFDGEVKEARLNKTRMEHCIKQASILFDKLVLLSAVLDVNVYKLRDELEAENRRLYPHEYKFEDGVNEAVCEAVQADFDAEEKR